MRGIRTGNTADQCSTEFSMENRLNSPVFLLPWDKKGNDHPVAEPTGEGTCLSYGLLGELRFEPRALATKGAYLLSHQKGHRSDLACSCCVFWVWSVTCSITSEWMLLVWNGRGKDNTLNEEWVHPATGKHQRSWLLLIMNQNRAHKKKQTICPLGEESLFKSRKAQGLPKTLMPGSWYSHHANVVGSALEKAVQRSSRRDFSEP